MKRLDKHELLEMFFLEKNNIDLEVAALRNKNKPSGLKIANGLEKLNTLLISLDNEVISSFDTRIDFYNTRFPGGSNVKFLKRLSNNLRFGSQNPSGISADSVFALGKVLPE